MGIFVPKTCIIKFYVIGVVDGKNTTQHYCDAYCNNYFITLFNTIINDSRISGWAARAWPSGDAININKC